MSIQSVNVDFTKVFRNAVSGIIHTSKFMNEKVDPFCDSIIQMVQELNSDLLQEDQDCEAFKQGIKTRMDIFFKGNVLRISKPKLESAPKRGINGYTLFVKETRETIAQKYNITEFADMGRHAGAEWAALSKDEKSEWNSKAEAINEEKGIVKKDQVEKVKKTLPTCEHEDCTKQVRSDAVDGVYLCADHKKKEVKGFNTCTYVNKHGIKCSTLVKDEGSACAKHTKSDDKKEEKKVEKKVEEKKAEKKEEKKVEKKVEEKKVEEKKAEKKVEKKVEEKKVEKKVEKKEAKPVAKAASKAVKKFSDIKFDFENEEAKTISDNEEYWNLSKKINKTNWFMHPTNKIVFEKIGEDGEEFKFIGVATLGSVEEHEEEEIPSEIIRWVEDCGFTIENKHAMIEFDE
jgi:hypothetical protein